jgi:mRNA-degrading endonuclease RelE of RelBE toxin-antitoxin system
MSEQNSTEWSVGLSSKARKQKGKLPPDISALFLALLTELGLKGPTQPSWPHYGKLAGRKEETHHCHLNKTKPVYVAVWKVLNKRIKLMEVQYVGTHENAPY